MTRITRHLPRSADDDALKAINLRFGSGWQWRSISTHFGKSPMWASNAINRIIADDIAHSGAEAAQFWGRV